MDDLVEEIVWLTVQEAADFLRLNKKTVRNKMTRRILRKGVHYFRPHGMGTRFKKSALIAWMEGREPRPAGVNLPADPPLMMFRGYVLGSGHGRS